MTKCPKVGDRVRYKGAEHVGPCDGVVTAIYEARAYDEAELDAAQDLDGDDYYRALRRAERGLKPEAEWHVSVKPDAKPEPWCYGAADKFAPQVKDLTKSK